MVWLEKRLEGLAGIFAVSVGGFSVMNHHLHLLLRLDPDVAFVKLVDYSGRLFREGRASISSELTGIFERLGCSAQNW